MLNKKYIFETERLIVYLSDINDKSDLFKLMYCFSNPQVNRETKLHKNISLNELIKEQEQMIADNNTICIIYSKTETKWIGICTFGTTYVERIHIQHYDYKLLPPHWNDKYEEELINGIISYLSKTNIQNNDIKQARN